MEKFSYDKCLIKIPSRFELVVVASKRAEQLLRGSRPRVVMPHNPARTALREICEGKMERNEEGRSYSVLVSDADRAAQEAERLARERARQEEEEQEAEKALSS